jgi:ribosomal protein RSM22 (predicted rRNA methylase)
LTVSYLLRKVPGSYAVAYKLMSEILKRNPSFSPKTMLDFGSGVGTWAWAFKNFFPDVKNIVGVEPNIFMRKLGKFVTNEYIKDMKFYESLSHTLELDYD